MATIDPSNDTVTMSQAEYKKLIAGIPTERPVLPGPFPYEKWLGLARETFETTMSVSAERSNWTKLQEDLIAWQSRTYGAQPFERQTLGIIEEMGEFDEAQDSAAQEDGLVDIVVFCSQQSVGWRLDLGILVEAAHAQWTGYYKLRSKLGAVGRLSHVTLKTLQGIRGMNDKDVARRELGKAIIDVLSWVFADLEKMRQAAPTTADLYEMVKPEADRVMTRTKQLPQVPA